MAEIRGASKIVVRATVWQVIGHLITLTTATGMNSYSSPQGPRGNFISQRELKPGKYVRYRPYSTKML